MAGLGSLVVSLEANIARFTSDMGRAANQTEQAMNRMDRSSQQTQRAMSSLQTTARLATGALVGLMAGLSVQKLVEYSDSWTNIESRIRLVTTSSTELASVQTQLFDIAQRNSAAMEPLVALYTRLAQGADTLGASQADMIKFTAGVSAAVLISGSGTAEAAGAMTQLSQAMSNTNIMAQEYNSINDGAPEILRAVARNIRGVDGDLGKLRQVMLAGGLSSKAFFAAFMKDTDNLEAGVNNMTLTVAQSFVRLNNEAMKFVGEASKASGAGQMIAGSINALSKNLDTLAAGIGGLMVWKMSEWTLLIAAALITKANAAYTVSGALATERFATLASAEATAASTAAESAAVAARAALIVELRVEALATVARTNAVISTMYADEASVLAMQSRSAAIIELAALGRAQVAIQASITVATEAETAATVALTGARTAATGAGALATAGAFLMANPITAIATVLGLAATAWMVFGNSAEKESKKAAGAVETSTTDIIADLDRQIKKLQERNGLAQSGLQAIAQDNTPAGERMASLRAQMAEVSAGSGDYAGLGDAAKSGLLATLGAQYGTLYAQIQTINTEKNNLAKSDSVVTTAKWMTEYATKEEKLAAKLKEISASYKDGIIPPEVEARARAAFAEKQKDQTRAIAKEESAEAKNILDGKLKDLESGLAKEQSELAFANDYITELYSQGVLDLSTYNDYRKRALESGLAISAAAYDAEIALALAYRENLKKGSQREAAQTKIDELRAGKAAAAQDLGQQDKMLSLDIQKKPRDDFNNLRFRADDRRNPIDAATNEWAAKDKIIQAYRETEFANDDEYYAKKEQNEADYFARVTEINQRYADDKAALDSAIMYQAGNTADQFYSMLKQAGQEQSALGQAAFLVSKALAVAQIILSTNVAAAAAMALPPLGLGPIAGIPYAIAIKAMGYASAGMTAGLALAGAREKGGPVWSGGAFLVGEKGPEIFQPSGHGTIIPNSSIGGGKGGAFNLTIVSNGTPQQIVESRGISDNERILIIQDATQASLAAHAAQLGDPNSKASKSIARNFNTQRSRS